MSWLPSKKIMLHYFKDVFFASRQTFYSAYSCHSMFLVLMVNDILLLVLEVLRLSLLEIFKCSLLNNPNAEALCCRWFQRVYFSVNEQWQFLTHILITIFTIIWFIDLLPKRLGQKKLVKIEARETVSKSSREDTNSVLNKAGYTATPVACGCAGAIIEVTRSFGQEQ